MYQIKSDGCKIHYSWTAWNAHAEVYHHECLSGVVNTMLDPRLLYSCMTAALKGAQSQSLPAARPVAYEHLIELFYQLAAAPHTSDATLAILRKVQLVALQLDTIANGLLSDQVLSFLHTPPQYGPHMQESSSYMAWGQVLQVTSLMLDSKLQSFLEGMLDMLGGLQAAVKGAALHQCAWLLQIAALQLHRADLALPAHHEDCQTLLQAFFGAPQTSDGNGALVSTF